jgi:hypothetical protein
LRTFTKRKKLAIIIRYSLYPLFIKSKLLLYLSLMKKCFSLFFTLLILFSCYTKQENTAIEKAISPNTFAQVVLILTAHLTFYVQPKAIFLAKIPAPELVSKHYNTENVKSHADKRTKNGKLLFLGIYLKSNFTNYT